MDPLVAFGVALEKLADISAGLAVNLAAVEQTSAVQSAQIAALAKSIELLTRATTGAVDGIAAQVAEPFERVQALAARPIEQNDRHLGTDALSRPLVPRRMSGFADESKRRRGRDFEEFPALVEDLMRRFPKRSRMQNAPEAQAELHYLDSSAITLEIDRFQRAAQDSGAFSESFMTAPSPGSSLPGPLMR